MANNEQLNPGSCHTRNFACVSGGTASPKCLVPYSRDIECCLGMELANVELYMRTATILRIITTKISDDGEIKVRGMKLFETSRCDIDIINNFGLPRCEVGRVNMRVVFE